MYPKTFVMKPNHATVKFLYKSALFLLVAVIAARPVDKNVNHARRIAVTDNRIPVNPEARRFVTNYIKENREILHVVKCRSRVTFNMIDTVFEHYGLPAEIKYLAVVESELKKNAVSAVGAKGMWQLMPSTAKQLGLRVDSSVDERGYAYKSTVAAAKYLKDLYGEFGDWLLVLAAYNSGPAPVYRAIKKSGSRDFWALQYNLPAESRLHVKRFIASHYYFEGKGSVATLTRSEWNAYAATQSIMEAEGLVAMR